MAWQGGRHGPEDFKKVGNKIRRFTIEDIPDEMTRRGWFVGAALMQRWFRNNRSVMSPLVKAAKVDARSLKLHEVDEKIVTMAWAMKFQRVIDGMNSLRANWSSAEAKKHLIDLLIKSNKPAPVVNKDGKKIIPQWRFGSLPLPVRDIEETCQVNYFKIGSWHDPLDDFSAALFRCTLKIAVTGIVEHLDDQGNIRIKIDERGFYIRDTYDFNDDGYISQPLGVWGYHWMSRAIPLASLPISTKKKYDVMDLEFPGEAYRVTNESFQEYRKKYAKGGDFVIYTDVYREKLSSPIVLELKL